MSLDNITYMKIFNLYVAPIVSFIFMNVIFLKLYPCQKPTFKESTLLHISLPGPLASPACSFEKNTIT